MCQYVFIVVRNWHEGRELMSNDVLVLLIVVVLALIFALVNGVRGVIVQRRWAPFKHLN